MSILIIEGFENKGYEQNIEEVTEYGCSISYSEGVSNGICKKITSRNIQHYQGVIKFKNINKRKLIIGVAFKVSHYIETILLGNTKVGFIRFNQHFCINLKLNRSPQYLEIIRYNNDGNYKQWIPIGENIKYIYPNKWYYLEIEVDLDTNYLKINLNSDMVIFDGTPDFNLAVNSNNISEVWFGINKVNYDNVYTDIYVDNIYIIDPSDGEYPTERLGIINLIQMNPYTTTYTSSAWSKSVSGVNYEELVDEQYQLESTEYIETDIDKNEIEFKLNYFQNYNIIKDDYNVLGFRTRVVRGFDPEDDTTQNSVIFKSDDISISASPNLSAGMIEHYVHDEDPIYHELLSPIQFYSLSATNNENLTFNEIEKQKYGFQFLKYKKV